MTNKPTNTHQHSDIQSLIVLTLHLLLLLSQLPDIKCMTQSTTHMTYDTVLMLDATRPVYYPPDIDTVMILEHATRPVYYPPDIDV